MCDTVNVIDGVLHGDDLQRIFEEGDTHGVSSKLRETQSSVRQA